MPTKTWAIQLVEPPEDTPHGGVSLRVVGEQHLTEPPKEQDFGKQAGTLARQMRALGWKGQPVLLLLPSTWTLCATIRTDALPRQQRGEAMLYRFEELLPYPAEQACAGFISGTDSALGISVRTQTVQPLIETLEQSGIIVQWLCPSALLLWSGLIARIAPPGRSLVLMDNGGRVECFTTRGKQLSQWQSPQYTPANIDLAIRREQLQHPRPAFWLAPGCAGKDTTQAAHDAGGEPDTVSATRDCQVLPELTHDQWLELGIAATLGRGRPLPINLRQGTLQASDPLRGIRPHLSAAAFTLAALLALACGAVFWRAHLLDQHAKELEDRQRLVYQNTFPGTTVPLSVSSRMQSEAKRLRAVSGTSGDVPVSHSALTDLHTLLTRLPDQLRYRINEVRLDRGELFIDGEARAHSDVDAIAASLRKQRGYSIDPPRIERLAQREGVRFTLIGQAPESTPPLSAGTAAPSSTALNFPEQ